MSLTDVDIGVEECDTPADEVDGSMEQETRKSKVSSTGYFITTLTLFSPITRDARIALVGRASSQ